MKLLKVYKSGKTVFEIGGVVLTPINDELLMAVDVTELDQKEIEKL